MAQGVSPVCGGQAASRGHSVSGRAGFPRGKVGHPVMARADLCPAVDARLASKKHPTHLSVHRQRSVKQLDKPFQFYKA